MINVNFAGYDIIVRDDESQENLIISKVISFNRENNVIEVNAEKNRDYEDRRLSILIYNNLEAYTFYGTARHFTGTDNVEIALYHGEQKSERKSQRFPLDIDAVIVESFSVGKKEPDKKRRIARILDISRSGIRIECREAKFQIHDTFALELPISGVTKIYFGKVVRMRQKRVSTEYGCILMTKDEFMRN